MGTVQFLPGTLTQTMGVNGPLLGPTIILQQGQTVTMNVSNQLGEPSTIHWHGMHVPPEADGGPHTPIAAGETWSPSFAVLERASTHWYHPHLHMHTNEQVVKGIAGLIIVRDPLGAALRAAAHLRRGRYSIGFDQTVRRRQPGGGGRGIGYACAGERHLGPLRGRARPGGAPALVERYIGTGAEPGLHR
ncbi:MAG: multicopper oxidase domain-containing protein [Flavobacteriales bacterium]|nr:multicopper oxidase domain-containing protein [Flavobacteriales bacterium]